MRSRTDSTASKALLQCDLSVVCGEEDDDDASDKYGSDSLNISLVVDDDIDPASRCG